MTYMPEEREFHPELLPRTGEVIAWALLLLVNINLFILRRWLGNIPIAVWVVWASLLFAAASISLNNWVERHTRLRLDKDGVTYENGIRSVRLTWPEVQSVSRFPARLGHTIQVVGQKTAFVFHTLGEAWLRDELRAKTGFVQGEEIFKEIVAKSNLQEIAENNGVVYYARR